MLLNGTMYWKKKIVNDIQYLKCNYVQWVDWSICKYGLGTAVQGKSTLIQLLEYAHQIINIRNKTSTDTDISQRQQLYTPKYSVQHEHKSWPQRPPTVHWNPRLGLRLSPGGIWVRECVWRECVGVVAMGAASGVRVLVGYREPPTSLAGRMRLFSNLSVYRL